MNSAHIGAFRYLGTILGSLFLLFGVYTFAYAQEELAILAPSVPEATSEDVDVDVEEAFFEDIITDDSVDITSTTILEEKPKRPNPEKSRVDSPSTVSVKQIKDISVQMAVFGFLLFALLINVAFLVRTKEGYAKRLTFWSMVAVIIVPSIFFVSSTVYINVISETKGPVHWHADFRVFACGAELQPPVPLGKLSNKTGTSEIHQHVDKRLHIEGVLVEKEEASLSNFFKVQGGEFTENSFTVPHSGGLTRYANGDTCSDGSKGEWNVFLYQTNPDTLEVTKEKLSMVDAPDYVLSPEINIPPGDCLIFEFGEEQVDTEYICDFYQIAINNEEITPTWTQ